MLNYTKDSLDQAIEVDSTYHYFKLNFNVVYSEKIEKDDVEILQRNGKIEHYLAIEQEKT